MSRERREVSRERREVSRERREVSRERREVSRERREVSRERIGRAYKREREEEGRIHWHTIYGGVSKY